MYSPIMVDTTVVITETIFDLIDKGKATVMIVLKELKDKDSGELKAKIYSSVFIRGIGGFGSKGKFRNPIPDAPKSKPHQNTEETTQANLAVLYRLSGDRNPLHIDPNMSAMGGFDVPILHGLCTYGITARALHQTYFKDDASELE